MVATELLETPEPATHLVQLYGANEHLLSRNVARYLWDGMKRGSAVLAVLTFEHKRTCLRELERVGVTAGDISRDGKVSFLDAYETLARIMVEGDPDPALFDAIVGEAVRDALDRCDDGERPRIYGEMVGILWKARQFRAAMRLEQLWNRLLKATQFSLFCAYPVSIFDEDFRLSSIGGPLCAHTHLLPVGHDDCLETALFRAADEVLGPKAAKLRSMIAQQQRPELARMSLGEATILWLRENLAERADEILARARQYFDQAA